jgi:hypothetical protein
MPSSIADVQQLRDSAGPKQRMETDDSRMSSGILSGCAKEHPGCDSAESESNPAGSAVKAPSPANTDWIGKKEENEGSGSTATITDRFQSLLLDSYQNPLDVLCMLHSCDVEHLSVFLSGRGAQKARLFSLFMQNFDFSGLALHDALRLFSNRQGASYSKVPFGWRKPSSRAHPQPVLSALL